METVELLCEKRTTRPKSRLHALRREGRVPAILYGPTTSATPVAVDAAELKARVAAAARQRIIRLKSSTTELDGKHVIFKDVQRSAVSGDILHADFYEVDLSKTVRVAVALKFVGRAAGVADGGILQPLERAVEVECLPLEIPESVEVDVSGLGIHDVIHVSALNFSGNVRPILEHDYPVVTVLPPTVAEAPAVAAAPAEAAAAEAIPAEGAAQAPAADAEPAAKEAASAPAGAKKG